MMRPSQVVRPAPALDESRALSAIGPLREGLRCRDRAAAQPSPAVPRGPESSLLLRHIQARELDALGHAMQRWDHRIDQISSGPFAGELLLAQLEGLQLGSLTFNQVIQGRGEQPRGSYV